MTLAGLSIRRPVATIMIMISIIFIGIIAMFTMKTELLPNMNIPVVTITTRWNGAIPDDVESQVTKKIEEILPNVEGIDRITSISSFGQSQIVIRFDYGINAAEKTTEVQREISRVMNNLPDDVSSPIIRKEDAGTGNQTLMIIFSGENRSELSTFLDQYFKPRLESLEGIGAVNIFGSPTKQIQIQVDPAKLEIYNMSPMELYNIISGSSFNVPLGTINTGTRQLTARFMGEANTIEEIENIIINSNGNMLKIKDVADVIFTTEDETVRGFLNGEDSVIVSIAKSADASTVELNDNAKRVLESLESILPYGTKYEIFLDTSTDINSSISNVSSSAVQGLILASIIMFVFLKNMRATLIASSSLPVAVVFTFAFLSLAGSSLNLISLMGLSIGVGMLTDNSVVVIDNIYRHMSELKSPVMEASENGTVEVTASVVASALTTMIVFIPILFIEGMARELFRDLAYSIIFSNIAAVVVSLTLIPMLSSRIMTEKMDITKEGSIFKLIKETYLKSLKWVGKNRVITLIFIGVLFVFSMIPARTIPTNFMPRQDQGRYSIIAELGNGIDVEKSNEIAKRIEEIVKNEEHTQKYSMFVLNRGFSFNIDIGKKEDRKAGVVEIMSKVRAEASTIPGLRLSVREDYSRGISSGRAVEMSITGTNLEELREIVENMARIISSQEGVVDVRTSVEMGIPEARIEINRDRIMSYGISPSVVAQHLNYYILGGNRGNTVTVKTGTEEIDILVRLPKEKRSDLNQLMNLNIKVGQGQFVKLSELADIVVAEGTSEIRKTDRVYSVTIGANDGGIGTGAVQNYLQEAFEATNPPDSVAFIMGGDNDNMNRVYSQLIMALGISIFLIYALLASQFESFTLPAIVMGSVPLALIGAIWGLIITNQSIDMMVGIGVILLAGIVVNNAIVLIDFIKMIRERGSTREESIMEAGRTRLRPILMTTATTIFGMIPLSLGLGDGAEVYRGLAIVVISGLSVSTFFTLLLIPVLYTILDDLEQKVVAILGIGRKE